MLVLCLDSIALNSQNQNRAPYPSRDAKPKTIKTMQRELVAALPPGAAARASQVQGHAGILFACLDVPSRLQLALCDPGEKKL